MAHTAGADRGPADDAADSHAQHNITRCPLSLCGQWPNTRNPNDVI